MRGYNMYSYCFNNPINMIDPSGNWPAFIKNIINAVKNTATNIVNGVNTENISETIGSTSNVNAFREDEVKAFEDEAALLQNAPEKQNNMFSIPKVI